MIYCEIGPVGIVFFQERITWNSFLKENDSDWANFTVNAMFLAITTVITTGLRLITTGKIQHLTMSKQLLIAFSLLGLEKVYQGRETFDAIIEKQAFSQDLP